MTAFIIIILLILLNGYFSLAEIALIAVKEIKLKEAADSGNKKAITALKLIKFPEEFLSIIQIGITLLGILEGIYGGEMVADSLQPLLISFGWNITTAHIASLVIGVGLITYITIVIGELIPKSIALQNSYRVTIAVAPSLFYFSYICYPVVKMLTFSTNFLLKILKIKNEENEIISEAELLKMLGTAYSQGVLEKTELFFHENIFSFHDHTVGDLMDPAENIITISAHATREEILNIVKQHPYSYFPVYEKNKDEIIGTISVKNFFTHPDEPTEKLIRRPYLISSEQKVADIFQTFKRDRRYFGIVVNSQGKFIGLLTIRNIAEGIVGNIPKRKEGKPLVIVNTKK